MPDALSGDTARVVSPAVLATLRELAQPQGYVTAEMLGRVLPVSRLSPEELARTIQVIEDAGIPIELEPALRRPRRPAAVAMIERERAPDAAARDVPATPQPLAPAAAPAPGSGADAHGTTAAEMHRRGLDREARVSAYVIAVVVVVCSAMIYVSGLLA